MDGDHKINETTSTNGTYIYNNANFQFPSVILYSDDFLLETLKILVDITMKSKEIISINNYKQWPTIIALHKLMCLLLKISSLTSEQQCALHRRQ